MRRITISFFNMRLYSTKTKVILNKQFNIWTMAFLMGNV